MSCVAQSADFSRCRKLPQMVRMVSDGLISHAGDRKNYRHYFLRFPQVLTAAGKFWFFYGALFLFAIMFPLTPALAGNSLTYGDIMGTWVSEPPGKILHCYLDTTFLLRIDGPIPKYYRGNFILQSGRKPIFFIQLNNHRVLCPFVSLKKRLLTIGGETAVAGQWRKKDNNYRGNW